MEARHAQAQSTASKGRAAFTWNNSECHRRVSDACLTGCATGVSCDDGHKYLPAQITEGRHPARDLRPVRQHALPTGQPRHPLGLEQMPHLLNFIQDNGVLMSNDHTVLISHTATGILTSLTGVYPDRMGQPASNSFGYFNTD